jgi:hypothetical protein
MQICWLSWSWPLKTGIIICEWINILTTPFISGSITWKEKYSDEASTRGLNWRRSGRPAGRNLHTLWYACTVLRPAGWSNEFSYLLRPPVQF